MRVMIDNYKYKLPNDFPTTFLNSAKSLKQLGILDIAWNWENAIMVIEYLSDHNYAILGGDVYRLNSGSLESTYDSWYQNKDITKSREQFVEVAKRKAISYINQYHESNGDDFYYSVVFEKI